MLFGNRGFYPMNSYPGEVNYNFRKAPRDWNATLNNIQKTLGIVNQALPIINQLGPIFRNARTMFKVVNEFKKIDTNGNVTNIASEEKKEVSDSNPNFFV